MSRMGSVSITRHAMDRSVRTFDSNGRLSVASAVLTRAIVSNYFGREIPNSEGLGLDPNQMYALLRPASELQKSIGGFNGLPILDVHVAVTAADYKPQNVVGSTGSDAAIDGNGDLTNSMTIWGKPGIDMIESGRAKSLSCGYGYDCVMRSGSLNGVPYQGIMTNIIPNHLALVNEGRVPGAIVGDSSPFPRHNIYGAFDMSETLAATRDPMQMQKCLAFLTGKISPELLAELEAIMKADVGPAEPVAGDSPDLATGSNPLVGSGPTSLNQAQDQAQRERAAVARAQLLPHLNRLRSGHAGAPLNPAAAMDGADSRAHPTFPNMNRLRNGQ